MESEITLDMILELNVDDLYLLSKNLLKSYFGSVISDGKNYIYAKKKSPICLVAHIDTVERNSICLYRVKQNSHTIIANAGGVLGGDDRSGVYMIFSILRNCALLGIQLPSILLTNHEELHQKGCKKFISDKVSIRNIDIFMGVDLSGFMKYTYYSKDIDDDIKTFIEKQGYIYNVGFMSDVGRLTEAFGIPSINISSGFYNEHTLYEYVVIDHVHTSIENIIHILAQMN